MAIFTGSEFRVAAQQAIANVSETLMATEAFSVTVSAKDAKKNDTVAVFVQGAVPEPQWFNRETNHYMTDNGGEAAWVSVNLSAHKKLTFSIMPEILDKLSTEALANMYRTYISKLCNSVIGNVDSYTGGGYFPIIEVPKAEDFDRKWASKIETALAKKVGGAGGDRYLLLGMDTFSALRESLQGVYVPAVSGNALVDGTIEGLSGFKKVIRTSAIFNETVAGDIGYATNRSGIAIAFAPIYTPEAFTGDVKVVSDPVTGIPITCSIDYDRNTRDYVATVEVLYGMQRLDSRGLIVIKAKAA